MEHQVSRTSGHDWQYAVAFTDYLTRFFDCGHIVAIGSYTRNLLEPLAAKYKIHGVKFNIKSKKPLAIPDRILRNAVIVCLDADGRLSRSEPMLRSLHQAMDVSPVSLIATRMHQQNSDVNQWKQMLSGEQLHVEFAGLTASSYGESVKHSMLAVIGNNRLKQIDPVQKKVAAIITAYNEEDIAYHTIRRLVDQGVYVYVIENWSTDSTYEILKGFEGHPFFLGCERYPAEGSSLTYDWKNMLSRVVEISEGIDADWFIHHDMDEIRQSPWPDKSLVEAISYVDLLGFNAIDHTLIEFYPTDNGYNGFLDYGVYFNSFDFGKAYTDFIQIKAWKRTGEKVSLMETGGHQALFPGRKVCPYKFLNRHYPIRSQQHAEKKIFRDRKARYNEAEVAQGFHRHYDPYEEGHNFLRDPMQLIAFDAQKFNDIYVVERLSGIGAEQARHSFVPAELPAPMSLLGHASQHDKGARAPSAKLRKKRSFLNRRKRTTVQRKRPVVGRRIVRSSARRRTANTRATLRKFSPRKVNRS